MTHQPAGVRADSPRQQRHHAVDPGVADACLPYLTEHLGNPSSSHAGSGPELAAAEVVPPPEASALPVMVRFMVRNDINP